MPVQLQMWMFFFDPNTFGRCGEESFPRATEMSFLKVIKGRIRLFLNNTHSHTFKLCRAGKFSFNSDRDQWIQKHSSNFHCFTRHDKNFLGHKNLSEPVWKPRLDYHIGNKALYQTLPYRDRLI